VSRGGLQEQFVTRKGFAFNADKPGMMEQQVRRS
jgi:magnesium chelatase subunit H